MPPRDPETHALRRSAPRRRGGVPDRETAESIAAEAFALIAEDPEEVGRFLDLTGVDASTLRRLAGEPGFLASAFGYVLEDERLARRFAEARGLTPEDLAAVAHRLALPGER